MGNTQPLTGQLPAIVCTYQLLEQVLPDMLLHKAFSASEQ